MRAVERGALGDLSPPAYDGGGRSGSDAPDRRVASGIAVLRLAADDVSTQRGRSRGQSEAGATLDARDGDRGAGSSPRHEPSRAGKQDISLPAARRGDHRAEPCVGVRHHLYSDGERPFVSGGDPANALAFARIGRAARCWRGDCRIRWIRASASTRWKRLWSATESLRYSIPTKARSSPAPPSPAGSRPPESRFRWTDGDVSGTTS